MSSTQDPLTDGELDVRLVMLHSHWLAADSVFATRKFRPPDYDQAAAQLGEEVVAVAMALANFYRLLVFYALLQVVIEAYEKLPGTERSGTLDTLLNLGPREHLRRLRNAVFHVQDEPFNAKLWTFLHTPDSEHWIYDVNRAFKSYFETRFGADRMLADLKRAFPGGKP